MYHTAMQPHTIYQDTCKDNEREDRFFRYKNHILKKKAIEVRNREKLMCSTDEKISILGT